MFVAVFPCEKLSRPLIASVLAACLLWLGLMGLGSARQIQQTHPGVPGVCRAVISKVQSYTESNLQSSLVGVRGGICSWLELNGCQQYKVVFTPVYKIAFRTVYVNGFICCPGYSRIGNACVPNEPVPVPPPTLEPTTPHILPENVFPATDRPGAPDSDQDGSSLLPGITGLFMTARPVSPTQPSTKRHSTKSPKPERTPGSDVDPPPGPRDRLLIILLILVILVALFALASFAVHFAKLWNRGRLTCCFGMLAMPRVRTGGDVSGESSKITCILSTITADCTTESVRSDLSDRSRRSGSDRSDQSGLSGSSEVTFIDDSDSGIVKHVVYERCWKDTTSLLSYSSSSRGSQESGPKISSFSSKKCAPLLNIPLTPLTKKRRPSPPTPVHPDRIYDTTPRSSPLPLPLPPPKRSSPPRQPSPGPYSYTSLEKQVPQKSSSSANSQSPAEYDSVVRPNRVKTIDGVSVKMDGPAYINVSKVVKKQLPIYVTLEPDTDGVSLATECCEHDDDDQWMTSHSPTSSSEYSVGYCALSSQVLPHRISGNGYDKLERSRQNLPLVSEPFAGPEYAVPSAATSTSCLVSETATESQVPRASPDLRRSGTMPSTTLEYLKLSEVVPGKESKQEERYTRAPRRRDHKEMVFIGDMRNFQAISENLKHNSVG